MDQRRRAEVDGARLDALECGKSAGSAKKTVISLIRKWAPLHAARGSAAVPRSDSLAVGGPWRVINPRKSCKINDHKKGTLLISPHLCTRRRTPLRSDVDKQSRTSNGTMKKLRKIVAPLTCLSLLGCYDDTTDRPAPANAIDNIGFTLAPAKRVLVVVDSDYASSAIALVDLATGEVDSKILTSGTKVSATTTALSGDVVLAQSPALDLSAVLIDRSHSVLTWIERGGSISQLSISTGFSANPQDYAQVSAQFGWASRTARNPLPSSATDDFDDGDDLLEIDLQARKIARRVPLGAHSTLAGAASGPMRMAFDGDSLWVPLSSLSADFKAQGAGRIVAIDAKIAAVVATVDLPSTKNCTTVRYLAKTKQLAVVCSGSFADPTKQSQQSAVAIFSAATPSDAAIAFQAAELPGGIPFSKDFACLDERHCAVTTFGDFAIGRPDKLWHLDLVTRKATFVANCAAAFACSGLFADIPTGIIWLGERKRSSGDLRRFDFINGNTELPSVFSNAGGIGATDLGAMQ